MRAIPLIPALVVALWLPRAAAEPVPAEPPAPAPQLEARTPTPAEQLERGRQAFDNGEYERALGLLVGIDAMELGRDQRILLHEMMGKCHFVLGSRETAAAQFFEVLKLDKAYELDEVRTPQPMLVLFEAVRLNKARELRRFPVEPERTIPGRAVPRVAPNNMFIAFAPAGVFRLAFLGTPGTGMALLVPQLLTIGGSVASYAWVTWYANNQDDTCKNAVTRNAFPTVKALNIVTAALSWLIYAVGIIDAFVSQRYHKAAPGGGRKPRVASGWRWGPPTGPSPVP